MTATPPANPANPSISKLTRPKPAAALPVTDAAAELAALVALVAAPPTALVLVAATLLALLSTELADLVASEAADAVELAASELAELAAAVAEELAEEEESSSSSPELVVTMPPCTEAGVSESEVSAAALLYASTVFPDEGGLMAPTMPFWQCEICEQ